MCTQPSGLWPHIANILFCCTRQIIFKKGNENKMWTQICSCFYLELMNMHQVGLNILTCLLSPCPKDPRSFLLLRLGDVITVLFFLFCDASCKENPSVRQTLFSCSQLSTLLADYVECKPVHSLYSFVSRPVIHPGCWWLKSFSRQH